MNNKFKVYKLVEKDNEIPMYIGITSKPLHIRLRNHLYLCNNKDKNDKKTNWLRNRLKNNIKINIIELENNLSKDEAIELEISYISYYGLENLKNSTLGGEGLFGYKYTPKQLANWYNLKPILQYDFKGNFIRKFESITKCANYYNISHSSVSYCVNNKNITSHGMIFVAEGDNNLKEKLEYLNKGTYRLYDIDKNYIDCSNKLNILLDKYNLPKYINQSSIRIYKNKIPKFIKFNYFIIHKNYDVDEFFDKVSHIIMYDKKCNIVCKFIKVSQVSRYLNVSNNYVIDVLNGIRKSCKGYLLSYRNVDCTPFINNNHKRICLIEEGIIIETFDSIKEASVKYKLDPSCISKVCYNKRKHTKGFVFKFIDDIV
mgnify:CR=1 FL=1